MITKNVFCLPVRVNRRYRTKVSRAGGHGPGKDSSMYILVKIVGSDGEIGLGEISDVESDWGDVKPAELEVKLRKAIIGMDTEKPETIDSAKMAVHEINHQEFQRSIAYAVESALFDLRAKERGIPFYEYLGGKRRNRIGVSWVAFIRGIDELEREILECVERGFKAFKLKVGDDIHLDRERVKVLRRIAGERAYIKIDASGAWDEADAVEILAELADLGVDAVETPLAIVSRSIAKHNPEKVNDSPNDIAAALARVRARIPMRVIEHVADFSDEFTESLINMQAVDAINVVPCQSGGPSRALHLLSIAAAGGVEGIIGSTVELAPGTAAAVHIGMASPAEIDASDLIGPGLLEDDVAANPLIYEQGTLRPPDGTGLGIVLDEQKIESLRVREGYT